MELARALREQGWPVQTMAEATGFKLHSPESERPHAVVISLRRLPSHGRETAGAIWYPAWARQAIRIVFFDGKPEAVQMTRQRFPTAAYTTWDQLNAVLEAL